jgi:hypothetical protein
MEKDNQLLAHNASTVKLLNRLPVSDVCPCVKYNTLNRVISQLTEDDAAAMASEAFPTAGSAGAFFW